MRRGHLYHENRVVDHENIIGLLYHEHENLVVYYENISLDHEKMVPNHENGVLYHENIVQDHEKILP